VAVTQSRKYAENGDSANRFGIFSFSVRNPQVQQIT